MTKIDHLLNPIHARPFPLFEREKLNNGADVIWLPEKDWQVFRLEVCFLAGRPFEHKRTIAKATTQMLKEGVEGMTAKELNHFTEQRGAYISAKSNTDTANLVLYGLKRHFFELLPLLIKMIESPAYSEDELIKYKKNQKKKLKADLSVQEVLCYKVLTERIFGANHPYGYNSTPEDYDAIMASDLRTHFKSYFSPNNSMWLLSGDVDEEMYNFFRKTVLDWKQASGKPAKYELQCIQKGTSARYISSGSNQASFRMGGYLFDGHHPDYAYVQIANILLGGFFGSRLMRRIRESESLSYNAYSNVEIMRYGGFWMVGADSHPKNLDRLESICKEEMMKLAEHRITDYERETLRNYMLGNLLQYFDGAFHTSEFVKHHLFDLNNPELYETQVHAIQEMDAEKIRTAVEKHLNPQEALKVIVA